MRRIAGAALLLLAACQAGDAPTGAGGATPGNTADTMPFDDIAPDAVLRFIGTEPFWGATVAGTNLTWSTPDNNGGEQIVVSRFAGRGGLTFSGVLGGEQFDLAITPAECSDGMSDRTYPFVTTVRLGARQLNGCGWREGDDLGGAP